jgi:hypothetical protein
VFYVTDMGSSFRAKNRPDFLGRVNPSSLELVISFQFTAAAVAASLAI